MGLTCSTCRTVLPPASKFCNACGAPVAGDAESVDRGRNPRSYTPKHLADRILTARSALEGERKQVTVLFADVQGSMELAEQVDAEDWHRILDGFFRILADGVHRFEGTVNQYTGDGIMALFGAPIAHEDHAQRACYAALHLDGELRRYADELRRTRGLSFAVRMGINSGEVVVGKIGDDLRMDYTAQGQVVGLAARIERLAEPGRIYLTRHTGDLVGGFFRLRDVGAFEIKGVGDRVSVFELQGIGPLRTRLDVSQARGFSRLVGRVQEMGVLEASLERAIRGEGQVVSVAGDAGLGKSRLCYEFAERCRGRGIPVVRAHAVAHGKAVPFLPILDLLRAYFGVAEQDDPRAARDKIAGRMVLLDGALTEAVPLMFEFLGIADPLRPSAEMEPEARQRRLFAVMGKIVRAQREPYVFLLEDLHWLDSASAAFLESLVESVSASGTLLLVNYRPEYRPRWGEKAGASVLSLAPLDDAALTALLAELLGNDSSLGNLGQRVCARTGGNPFFIEEVVHELAESGVLEGARGAYRAAQPIERVAIPGTVQAVIAARIDRLPDLAKQVLQTAAVIGKEFSAALVGRIANLPETDLAEALRTLLRADLVVEAALYPEALYGFKHPLTQEVAYRSQLAERRRQIHAAVARAIEEVDAARLDERATLLAHHWEEAGEWVEAARWSRRAAEWARSRDMAEVMAHWRKARALLTRAGESPETAPLALEACAGILGHGWLVGISSDEAAAVFAQGTSLAAHDPRWLARLLAQYASAKASHGEVDEYLRLSREAVRIADETNDAALQAAVRTPLVRAHLVIGQLREALVLTEQALARMPADPQFGSLLGVSPYLNLWLLKADLLGYAGRWPEAAAAFEHTMRVCREHGHVVMLAHTCTDYAWWSAFLGDGQTALVYARQGLEIAEKMGSRMTRLFAYNALGFAEVQVGRPHEAVALLEQARSIASEMQTVAETQVDTLTLLARAYLGTGDHDRARAAAEEAVAGARKWNARAWECIAQVAYGLVLVHSRELETAAVIDAALARALALIKETGARCFEPFVRLQRAELAHRRGDTAGHDGELLEAHRLFAEMSVRPPQLPQDA
jgi:class 3 adenylate cyclase/tetratricopeptide (TPR) repeat protein